MVVGKEKGRAGEGVKTVLSTMSLQVKYQGRILSKQ
jgi:hypothetical protein